MGSHEYLIALPIRKQARQPATSAGPGEGKQEELGLGVGMEGQKPRRGEARFCWARPGADGETQESESQSWRLEESGAPGRPGKTVFLGAGRHVVPQGRRW